MKIDLKYIKNIIESMSLKQKDAFILSIFKIPEGKKAIEKLLWTVDKKTCFENAIKKIDRNIFGRSGIVLKKWEAKKAISEYKKETNDPIWEIKLMLYYVERMEKFTREYGDIDEGFYVSIEETFRKALKNIDKNKIQSDFYEDIKMLANKIIDFGYWWWFSDQIEYYFNDWKEKNKWNL